VANVPSDRGRRHTINNPPLIAVIVSGGPRQACSSLVRLSGRHHCAGISSQHHIFGKRLKPDLPSRDAAASRRRARIWNTRLAAGSGRL